MSVERRGRGHRSSSTVPNAVPKLKTFLKFGHLNSIWNDLLQFCHCTTHIVRSSLNVLRSSGADVRVPQNALDRHIGYTKAIEIAAKSPSRGVPAVPLRNTTVACERVTGLFLARQNVL